MFRIPSAITLLCAALMAGSAAAGTDSVTVATPDYTVFIDPPTGFVFVKLPQGWKFSGRVTPEDVARLPSGVLTALLKDEDARVAAAPARAARAQ